MRGKKTERQKLIDKLDRLTSLIIREKIQYCVTCMEKGITNKENLNNGHLFTRGHYSTRWDLEPGGNCATQCWGCNYKHEHDPGPFTLWYIKKYGQKAYEELHFRHCQICKISTQELRDKVEQYTQILSELTS